MRVSRRTFCALASQTLAVANLRRLTAQGLPGGVGPKTTRPNVALIQHDRILSDAKAALSRPPEPPAAAGKQGSDTLRRHLFQLSVDIPALAAGATLTHTSDPGLADRCTQRASERLLAWVAEAAPTQNPANPYERIFPTSGPEEILEAMGLAEVAVAIPFLRLPADQADPIHAWLNQYLTWLTTSRLAGLARDQKDHHASSWLLQATALAKLSGDDHQLGELRHRFRTVTLRAQIDGRGMFPHELTSTSALRDSLLNLDLLAGVCELLSTRFDSAWTYELPDGPGMHSAVACFYPFIQHHESWIYPADLENFNELPGRRPALLLAGRAYAQAEYAALWIQMEQSGKSDSTERDIIRSFPIRQPLLWVTPPPPTRA